MVENPARVVLFSEDECRQLLDRIAAVDPARWYRRQRILSIPTGNTSVCDYFFFGDKQQTPEFNQFLRGLAPFIEGVKLREAIINRYDPGQYIPEHKDVSRFRYNIVAPLQANGDGCSIRGEFVEDELGVATVFPYSSPPHAVPPVKQQRFVVIYLYE